MLPKSLSPFNNITFEPQAHLFYPQTIYERIEEHIRDAEARATENQEVWVEVLLADGTRLPVASFGYHNPGFIVVYGYEPRTGQEIEALISHTNIQVLIHVDARMGEKARGIGFLADLGQKENEE